MAPERFTPLPEERKKKYTPLPDYKGQPSREKALPPPEEMPQGTPRAEDRMDREDLMTPDISEAIRGLGGGLVENEKLKEESRSVEEVAPTKNHAGTPEIEPLMVPPPPERFGAKREGHGKSWNEIELFGRSRKEIIDRLSEKALRGLFYRPRIWFNDVLLTWQSDTADRYAKAVDEANEGIETVQAEASELLARRDEQMKSLREQFSDLHSATIDKELEREAARERQATAKKIEKLKTARDRAHAHLQTHNEKKEHFESQRNTLATKVFERVTTRLAPYERQYGELEAKKDALDADIVAFGERLADAGATVEEWEKKVGEAATKTVRGLTREKLALLKRELKASQKELAVRIKERGRVEKRLLPITRKMRYWQLIGNEFARVTHREVPYEQGGEWNVETPKGMRRETPVVPHGMPEAVPEPQHYEEPMAEAEPTLEEKPTAEQIQQMENSRISPLSYLGRWNTYFGAAWLMGPEELQKIRARGFSPDRAIEMKALEKMLWQYALENGKISRTLSQQKIKSHFHELRIIFWNERRSADYVL